MKEVISYLLAQKLGPILVFTETRKEASTFAEAFTSGRVGTTSGLKLAEQLDLFSEPTESSDKLKSFAEKCVAFHTADLSAQERQVLEEGFVKSRFDVCFATSTLAAGVSPPSELLYFRNSPFDTVTTERSCPFLTIGICQEGPAGLAYMKMVTQFSCRQMRSKSHMQRG